VRRPAAALAALGLSLVGLGALGVATALPASAHAEIVSATPAEGQRLESAPTSVTLKFSEPVSIDTGYLRVLDKDGKRLDTGKPQHPGGDGTAATVSVKAGLPDGGYLVSWRVVSADSHPIGGAYSFVVGDGAALTTTGQPDGGAVDGLVKNSFTVIRWLGFAGLALLGGAVFLTVCWRDGRRERRARALVWTGWGLVAGSAAVGLLLEGPYGAGTRISKLFSPALLDATLHTGYGRMLSARLVLLAALAGVLVHLLDSADSPPWLEDAGALAGLGVLATFGGAGHAVAGNQAPLAVFSDTAHLAAMATWLGGLVMIVACLLRRADALGTALPKFSPLAMGCVATLVVTGTYRSWRDIGSWDALFGTTYGRIVVVKIALLALLVVLGNASRLWVRRHAAAPVAPQPAALVSVGGGGGSDAPPPDDEDPPAAARIGVLRKSVGAELAVAAVVLAFTAVLVAEPPARATYVKPSNATVTLTGGDRVQVSVTPAKAGPNSIELTVLDPSGKARDAQAVDAFARLPGTQYDRLPVALVKAGPGHYLASAVALPAAGKWELNLTVRLSQFDAYTAVAPVTVR
jgi:copper transport protein